MDVETVRTRVRRQAEEPAQDATYPGEPATTLIFPKKTWGCETGRVLPLSCRKRGEAEGGVSGEWAVACGYCWAVRALPSDGGYAVRYVNELICDEDTACLSG